MFLLHSRRGRVQMAGKKTEDGNETKEMNPSSLPGSISNLLPLQLAFWEGNGSSQSPWSVASCPSNPTEHHSYPGFLFIKHRPCLQHFNKAALHFLEEIAVLSFPNPNISQRICGALISAHSMETGLIPLPSTKCP